VTTAKAFGATVGTNVANFRNNHVVLPAIATYNNVTSAANVVAGYIPPVATQAAKQTALVVHNTAISGGQMVWNHRRLVGTGVATGLALQYVAYPVATAAVGYTWGMIASAASVVSDTWLYRIPAFGLTIAWNGVVYPVAIGAWSALSARLVVIDSSPRKQVELVVLVVLIAVQIFVRNGIGGLAQNAVAWMRGANNAPAVAALPAPGLQVAVANANGAYVPLQAILGAAQQAQPQPQGWLDWASDLYDKL